MSTEANKTVIQWFFEEVWNQGNLKTVDDIVAKHVLGHDATSLEPKRGFENVKQVVRLFHTAFPDAHYLLFDLIAEGDKVVAALRFAWYALGHIHGCLTDRKTSECQ